MYLCNISKRSTFLLPRLSNILLARYSTENRNLTNEEVSRLIIQHYENHHLPFQNLKYRKYGPPYTNTSEVEKIPLHTNPRPPQNRRDRFALKSLSLFKWIAHKAFGNDHLQHAMVLESIAGLPGIIAGVLKHLSSMQRMKYDEGWITILEEEAENERMHLLAFKHFRKVRFYDRFMIFCAQTSFLLYYTLLYIFSPATAHRLVGYLEEEALDHYTDFIKAIDEGKHPNPECSDLSRAYWNLPPGSTLRDIIIVIRADELNHRDVNHRLSDMRLKKEDPKAPENYRYV